MIMFTFTEYDLGNSPMVSTTEGSLSFSLNTERSFMDLNELTSLTVSDANGKDIPGGSIDWKKKTIEVMGATKPWAEVKRKPGGLLSTSREWEWAGKKYATSSKNRIWTIKSGEETIAVLTPLKIHAFKKDELATLTFYVNSSKKEMIFIIFAILFATLRLPAREKPPTLKDIGGEAAATGASNVAGYAATTAVSSCCTVQ
ncbi:hypothetical protein BDZ94DRAFT_1322738 [Collybia nuda]|uniref:Uncharacterized protein n=1 Tax=Collybia nuda TaxID=64659 RepID=A0A9P6CDW4_9AGAR|nr:hypothetical protein BDZ94DRAFT_1322738 [Collybia nuda]